jgi:diacylglycerol kinase family enzyme
MAIAIVRVLRRHRGVTVTIDTGGTRRAWRSPFVFVGNNEYEIDGIRLGGRAKLDAGQLFVYLAPRLRTRDLPLLLLKALLGHGRSSGAFEIVSAAEVTIDSRTRRRRRVAIDGEVRQLPPPLRYRLRARALRVIVPQP